MVDDQRFSSIFAILLIQYSSSSSFDWKNNNSDCRKLERDFPEVNGQKMVDQCVDLGVYCNSVMNTGGRWSMERLVWYLVCIFYIIAYYIYCYASINHNILSVRCMTNECFVVIQHI